DAPERRQRGGGPPRIEPERVPRPERLVEETLDLHRVPRLAPPAVDHHPPAVVHLLRPEARAQEAVGQQRQASGPAARDPLRAQAEVVAIGEADQATAERARLLVDLLRGARARPAAQERG